MKINILIATIALIFSFATLVQAQGWERLYPDFPENNIFTAMRVAPATGGGFHVLVTRSYTAVAGGAFYLMKTDNNGNVQNTTTFGAGEQHIAFDMLKAANGDLIILSKQSFTQGVQITDTDVAFLRVDEDYNIISQSSIGASDIYEQPRDIIELPSGEFWLAGLGGAFPANSFLQKLDAQGQAIGVPVYAGLDYLYATNILPDATGGARVVGYARENNIGEYKTFIKDYDSNGSYVGQAIFEGTNGSLIPQGIIETTDNGLLIACHSEGTSPVLIKTDLAGTEVWRNSLPFGSLYLTDLKESANGYRILYRQVDPGPFQHIGFLETDLQGNYLSKKDFSIYYSNVGQDFIILPDNGTLIAGIRQRIVNNYDATTSGGIPYLIRTDAAGNTFSSGVAGAVSNDDTDDCLPEGIDLSTGKYISVFQDGLAIATDQVDPAGNYLISAPPGTYKLAVHLPNFLWSSCQDSIDLIIPAMDTLADQDFVIAYNNEPLDSIYGYVFEDYDNDCVRDSFEVTGYAGWIVHLEISEDNNVASLTDTTDANGYYSFTDLPGFTNGAVALIWFEQPIGTGLNCSFPCWQEAFIGGPFSGTTLEFNNGVSCDTLPFCPILSVAIATDEIRACSDEQYIINYCNTGGETAIDAYLEVTIDTALSVTGASIPWSMQDNNVYTFELGNLLSNECGSIQIDFTSPCDDPFGTTYCSSVYAYPDSTCATAAPDWDGSEIELGVECVGDSVRFNIQNIGSGDMLEPLKYIVIEDNVLLYSMPQPFQLTSGAEMKVTLPINGSFYRMTSEQPLGFPGLNTPTAWIEGCGEAGGIPQGFTNQFPLGDEDSWEDIFCIESTNSYDPNDKNGFPRGIGEAHYIDQNEALEYIIRFQNTGNAEAFVVEIRDTLPFDLLQPGTVRPGAASHPYTWNIEGNGVVVFRFENINLPDENSDPEGSKGFVQFKVEQQLDLPIGTLIENTAAIYFDHNPPIITNQTAHLIGEDFLATWIREISAWQLQQVVLSPNPMKDQLYIDLPDFPANERLTVAFFNVMGQMVSSKTVENKHAINDLEDLASGVYFLRISNDGQLLGVGKVVKE